MNLEPGFIIRVMAALEYACEAPIPNFTDDNVRDLVGLYDSFKLMSRCFSLSSHAIRRQGGGIVGKLLQRAIVRRALFWPVHTGWKPPCPTGSKKKR
jgi:hypothetical protein